MSRMEVRGDHLDGRDDVGEIGILGLAERRRHADVDGVERPDDRGVSRSPTAVRPGETRATSAVGTSWM